MDIETELRQHIGFLERDLERLIREARERDLAMAELYERQQRLEAFVSKLQGAGADAPSPLEGA